jgi:hypothetical protein
MRTTAACPKCPGRKLAVTELRIIYSGEFGRRVETVPTVGFLVPGFLSASIERLAAERPDDVRIVDPPSGGRNRSADAPPRQTRLRALLCSRP